VSKIPDYIEFRIKSIQNEIDLISSWGYGNLNFDAVFKWANIIHEFHKRFGKTPQGLSILDVGGGLGPLDQYFTNFGQVKNIDLSHEKTWFQTDSSGILVGAEGPKFKNENLLRITGDFFSIAKTLEEKFDFIYDSCSMIHFQRNFRGNQTNLNFKNMDKALIFFSRVLSKLMNKDALFISATDMSHPSSIEFKEIICQNRILNSINHSGFTCQVIVGENSYSSGETNWMCNILRLSDSYKLKFGQAYQFNLTTEWPKNFIRAKTAVGVFLFTFQQSLITKYSISFKLRIKSWIAGKIYFLFNPIQVKIRQVIDKKCS
jgi:SAM-dependent methyltransferase